MHSGIGIQLDQGLSQSSTSSIGSPIGRKMSTSPYKPARRSSTSTKKAGASSPSKKTPSAGKKRSSAGSRQAKAKI